MKRMHDKKQLEELITNTVNQGIESGEIVVSNKKQYTLVCNLYAEILDGVRVNATIQCDLESDEIVFENKLIVQLTEYGNLPQLLYGLLYINLTYENDEFQWVESNFVYQESTYTFTEYQIIIVDNENGNVIQILEV